MANTVWMIDPDTKDLVFDDDGILKTLEDNEAAAQNIRLTLEAFKGDFDLVPDHGTDYEQILGQKMDEETADEVIREAAFQEDRLAVIEELTVTEGEHRSLEITFSGQLDDGSEVSMEVSAG